MNVSDSVKDWLSNVNKTKYKNISDLIKSDIVTMKRGVSELILNNQFKLEGSWSNYVLDDVSFTYEEDVLKFRDTVESLYGISLEGIGLHPLSVDDIGIVIAYQYNLYDLYGKVMETVNAFHLAVGRPDKGLRGNKWFVA